MKRALALTLAAGIVGAGIALSATRADSAAVFANRYVTFRYPATWHTREWTPAGGALRFAVWLSNLDLPPACVRSGNSTRCSTPLRRLPPGAVFVTWELSALPGSPPQALPLWVARPGACRTLGTDETIRMRLGGSVFVNACIRGPGVAAAERQVRAMLESAHADGP